MLLPVEQRNPTIASETKKKIITSFEILDNQLNKYNFIQNDELGLADIPIGCWLHRCVILDLKFSEFKSLDRWYRKLEENEAFHVAVISAPLPPN